MKSSLHCFSFIGLAFDGFIIFLSLHVGSCPLSNLQIGFDKKLSWKDAPMGISMIMHTYIHDHVCVYGPVA